MLNDEPNTALLAAVAHTPEHFVSKIPDGKGFSSANAEYQLLLATSLWGPCGQDWGYTTQQDIVTLGADPVPSCVVTKIRLWYGGSRDNLVETVGVALTHDRNKDGWKLDPEAWSKSETRARTKAFKLLGFSADIALGARDGGPKGQAAAQTLKDFCALPEPHPQAPPTDEPCTARQVDEIEVLAVQTQTDIDAALEKKKIPSLSHLTRAQAEAWLVRLRKLPAKDAT